MKTKTQPTDGVKADDLRTFIFALVEHSYDKNLSITKALRLDEVRNGSIPSHPKIGSLSSWLEIRNIVLNGNNVIIKGRV